MWTETSVIQKMCNDKIVRWQTYSFKYCSPTSLSLRLNGPRGFWIKCGGFKRFICKMKLWLIIRLKPSGAMLEQSEIPMSWARAWLDGLDSSSSQVKKKNSQINWAEPGHKETQLVSACLQSYPLLWKHEERSIDNAHV